MNCTAKDKRTGEAVEKQGHRRTWEVRDILRAHDGQKAHAVPPMKSGKTDMREAQRDQDTKHDRLEDRIKRYEPGDHTVKGPASVLAHMDARLRAGGVSEKDRESARDHAAKLLSRSVTDGNEIPMQKLANVTKLQEVQAGDGQEQKTRNSRDRQKC